MLCKESVYETITTPQVFHDEQMMELIHGLSEVCLQVVGFSPHTEGFVEM